MTDPRCDHGTGNGLGLIGGADNVENSIDHDRLVGTFHAWQQYGHERYE